MQRKSSTRWVLTFCVLLLVLGSGYTQDQGRAYPNEQRNAKNVLTELLEASITVSKALLSWKRRIAKFTRSFLTMGHEVEEEPEEQDMPTVYYTKKPLVIDQNTVTNVRHHKGNEFLGSEEADEILAGLSSSESKIIGGILRGSSHPANSHPKNLIYSGLGDSQQGRRLQETNLDQASNSPNKDPPEKAEQENLLQMIISSKPEEENIPLQAPNQNCTNGVPSVTKITAFLCGGVLVPETEYNTRTATSGSNCKRVSRTVQGCYCPYDYYGRACDQFAGFTCTSSGYTDFDQACLAEYNKKGNRRIGYAPCRPFKGDKYEFSMTVSCNMTDVDQKFQARGLKGEGIKLQYLYASVNNLKVEQPIPAPVTFTYSLVNPDYKVSKDLVMRFGINYLKWANIFERVEDVETRKASSFVTNQATKEGGLTNIVVRKSLSLEALKARGVYQYGRIPFRLHTTYELSPEKDRVGMSTTGFPKVFIADDMTYTLPPAAKKTSVLTWILLGIGLGLVVLIGIGVWWWFRKRKLNNKTKTPSAEERLVAVSDDQQGGESRLIGQSREVAAGSSS